MTEKLKEVDAMERIWKPSALEREKSGKKIKNNDPHSNLNEGWTHRLIAKKLNTSE